MANKKRKMLISSVILFVKKYIRNKTRYFFAPLNPPKVHIKKAKDTKETIKASDNYFEPAWNFGLGPRARTFESYHYPPIIIELTFLNIFFLSSPTPFLLRKKIV